MTTTATIRVMSAEEIAARGGGAPPQLQWPVRATVFAERAMRLAQRAPGNAMGDYLRFVGAIAQAQQARLSAMPDLALPDADHLDRAARQGVPPLPASEWPRDPAWHGVLRSLAAELVGAAPPAAQATLRTLAQADGDWLEGQADALLTGVMNGLDLAAAPVVAAALQVCWTHLLLATQARHGAGGQAFGRIDDALVCPCCGSRPVAAIVKSGEGFNGQRYLHCGLCSLQWHLPRGQCSHCGSTKPLVYDALAAADAGDDESARAAQAAVQAEVCGECDHYVKLMHTERDPFVEPVADDLATLTLDLLVSDAGKLRHGVNLMLLFGDAEPPPGAAPPPDPGAG
jgi:FdhE protein